MNISKNNYEAFFLDYHEGNLTPQQVAELLLFIEQHPELKEEFESFENFSLDDLSEITFENKAGLKKEITLENKEEYFIRAVENTLNPTEQQLIDHFLQQHPQYITDFELFKKTKLQADAAIVFEDKDALKDIAITTDYLLISSVEGLLSAQETSMLNHQLAVDAEMQQSFALYQQTKLTADANIVFENKQELKRKERKVIPFYYYVAAAAAILVLFGLSVLFNNTNNNDKKFAANTGTTRKLKTGNNAVTPAIVKENSGLANSISPAIKAAPVKKERNTNANNAFASNKTSNKKENKNVTPVVNETHQQIAVAQVKEENKEPKVISDPENAVSNKTPQTNEQPAIAQATPNAKAAPENEVKNNSGFLSLGEIAAQKIKQKTMDNDALASEKKNGKLNKFSGWDALQVMAKGVSKLTGKKVEVKPTYNDAGEVTAYAFNAGKLGFSKER